MMRKPRKSTAGSGEVTATGQTTTPDGAPFNGNQRENIDDNPESFEQSQANERETTPINNGPYGDVAILSLDGDHLRSLGINPDRVNKIQYRPYKGALLIEPVSP